jgi:hypothetical protein
MRIVFILDSSSSMLRKGENNFTYFDYGVGGIEAFIKTRMKLNTSKSDKYFLLLNNSVLSSHVHNLQHFFFQLNYIKHNRY